MRRMAGVCGELEHALKVSFILTPLDDLTSVSDGGKWQFSLQSTGSKSSRDGVESAFCGVEDGNGKRQGWTKS
jgi:hypothetical protein